MSKTFIFAELDRDTREYLLEARERKGKGMPGVFAPLANPLPGCGAICGPIIILVTLLFTLTDWINLIYDDPNRVAFLQTAGLILGGWMFLYALRAWAGGKGSSVAGTWIYADALHIYEARREQVVITPIPDIFSITYDHKYQNNKYSNTVVKIALDRGVKQTITIGEEGKAERFV